MYIFMSFSVLLILLGFWQTTKQGKENKNSGKIFMVVSFSGLLILSGCRGLSVGTDTDMFVRYYTGIRGISDIKVYENRFEFGFRLFSCILAQIRNDPHVLLFVSALITLCLLYYFFYTASDIPWYSVLMFIFLMFYYNSMCLLRQYIAIALTCMAYIFLTKKKKVWFVAFTVLAGSFHTSALVFLVMLPVSFVPLKKKNRYAFVAITVAGVLFAEYFIQLVVRLMPRYESFITSDKYYLQNKLGTFMVAAVYLLFFVVIDCIFSHYYSDDDRTRLEYWVALIGFAISLASVQGWIISRIGTYFTIMSCVFMPNAISKIESKKVRLILGMSILAGCMAYNVVIFAFRPYWSGVIPYYFWNQAPVVF